MIEDCTAIILAGGDSRRMGSDKANLLFGGQTLLQRVSATMQEIFPHVIISVRRPRPEIGLPQVCDERAGAGAAPGDGPLAGLVAGLGRVTTPWAFAVACDMPFVEPAVVELLGKFRPACQAVVPVVQGYPQPLAAFYASSCLAEMRASLLSQDKSLRGMLQKLDACYVDQAGMLEADPLLRSFFDLDTPQDVEAALHGVK
ncbi:MAG TPA: molybdenum cofactor guanylyltransferase [Gallionella sp.]|nr:molybdenum cofactor guanylyltransferase [Gallionella sp.]